MTISRSPERNTFQMERYIERCKEEGKEPSQDYLDMFLETQRDSMSKLMTRKHKSIILNMICALMTGY
jgi:predicted HicB family RNase H-like nuclease